MLSLIRNSSVTSLFQPAPLHHLSPSLSPSLSLTLNPSPRGEGLKKLITFFLLPFSPGRRGWGMRWTSREKVLGNEVEKQGEGVGK